jgi:hypothetical protein
MECPGYIRADGAVIAPGDVIKPVSGVPVGPIQNVTLRVLKVNWHLFLLHISPLCYFRKMFYPLNLTKVDNGLGFFTVMLRNKYYSPHTANGIKNI